MEQDVLSEVVAVLYRHYGPAAVLSALYQQQVTVIRLQGTREYFRERDIAIADFILHAADRVAEIIRVPY